MLGERARNCCGRIVRQASLGDYSCTRSRPTRQTPKLIHDCKDVSVLLFGICRSELTMWSTERLHEFGVQRARRRGPCWLILTIARPNTLLTSLWAFSFFVTTSTLLRDSSQSNTTFCNIGPLTHCRSFCLSESLHRKSSLETSLTIPSFLPLSSPRRCWTSEKVIEGIKVCDIGIVKENHLPSSTCAVNSSEHWTPRRRTIFATISNAVHVSGSLNSSNLFFRYSRAFRTSVNIG